MRISLTYDISYTIYGGHVVMGYNTVSIGNQGFDDIRENKYFYIDKTDLIKEWWSSGDAVTLITRPRRFGKTLNMSMCGRMRSTGSYRGRIL